jgi:hypothetical protein
MTLPKNKFLPLRQEVVLLVEQDSHDPRLKGSTITGEEVVQLVDTEPSPLVSVPLFEGWNPTNTRKVFHSGKAALLAIIKLG